MVTTAPLKSGAEHLTALEPHKLRRRVGCQPTLIQIPQHLEPGQFSIAHQPNRHPKHPPKNPPECHFKLAQG